MFKYFLISINEQYDSIYMRIRFNTIIIEYIITDPYFVWDTNNWISIDTLVTSYTTNKKPYTKPK